MDYLRALYITFPGSLTMMTGISSGISLLWSPGPCRLGSCVILHPKHDEKLIPLPGHLEDPLYRDLSTTIKHESPQRLLSLVEDHGGCDCRRDCRLVAERHTLNRSLRIEIIRH